MNEEASELESDEAQDEETLSTVAEVDALVNMLRFAREWSYVLDDGKSNLSSKLEEALREAIYWRAKLMN